MQRVHPSCAVQEVGRCGRSGRDGLAFLVCFDSPIEQHIARNPDALFSKPVEAVDIDPSNAHILRQHALCAATEVPIHAPMQDASEPVLGIDDRRLFGPAFCSVVEEYAQSGRLVKSDCGEHYWQPRTGDPRSLYQIDLRHIEQDQLDVLLEPALTKIDSFPYTEAFFTLFEGSVFLHQVSLMTLSRCRRPDAPPQGQTLIVSHLDVEGRVAHVKPASVNYFTATRDDTDVDVVSDAEQLERGLFHRGEVQVITNIWGFNKIRERTMQIIETCPLALPVIRTNTEVTASSPMISRHVQ